MIPITLKPEPDDFNTKVRILGQKFLENYPNPTKENWKKKGNKIYRKASKQLRDKYNKICAYSAEWVPSGDKSIDHFIPKSVDKNLAFEWNNFRLCFEILNQNKGSQIILDPFKIKETWFVIDFDTYLIKSNQKLDDELREAIYDTVNKILKLNDNIFLNRRIKWIDTYYKGTIATIEGLRRKAPFIAYELERQDLVNEIKVKHERYLRMIGKI